MINRNLSMIVAAILLVSCSQVESSNTTDGMNQLTQQEKDEGWELLFDGESTDKWRGYNMETFPGQAWRVEDELLVYRPPDDEDSAPLDIITKETYADFELKIEWMIERGGNSGIFYHVLEQPDQAIYWSGPEVQILDNENHPDADQGTEGNRKSGSLYDLIPAQPQNARSHDVWNTVKIVSEGPVIQHWQNGEKVVEFERWTPEWFKMLHESKFECYPEFGALRQGHIGLQDHGDVVKFRNIKIRSLNI